MLTNSDAQIAQKDRFWVKDGRRRRRRSRILLGIIICSLNRQNQRKDNTQNDHQVLLCSIIVQQACVEGVSILNQFFIIQNVVTSFELIAFPKKSLMCTFSLAESGNQNRISPNYSKTPCNNQRFLPRRYPLLLSKLTLILFTLSLALERVEATSPVAMFALQTQNLK